MWALVSDFCVVYPNHPGIEIRVSCSAVRESFILRQKHHDVGVCAWVDRVLTSLHIVGRIMDLQGVVPVNVIIDNLDLSQLSV